MVTKHFGPHVHELLLLLLLVLVAAAVATNNKARNPPICQRTDTVKTVLLVMFSCLPIIIACDNMTRKELYHDE